MKTNPYLPQLAGKPGLLEDIAAFVGIVVGVELHGCRGGIYGYKHIHVGIHGYHLYQRWYSISDVRWYSRKKW